MKIKWEREAKEENFMEDGRLNSKLDMGERKGGGELKLQGKKKKKNKQKENVEEEEDPSGL